MTADVILKPLYSTVLYIVIRKSDNNVI